MSKPDKQPQDLLAIDQANCIIPSFEGLGGSKRKIIITVDGTDHLKSLDKLFPGIVQQVKLDKAGEKRQALDHLPDMVVDFWWRAQPAGEPCLRVAAAQVKGHVTATIKEDGKVDVDIRVTCVLSPEQRLRLDELSDGEPELVVSVKAAQTAFGATETHGELADAAAEKTAKPPRRKRDKAGEAAPTESNGTADPKFDFPPPAA